MHRKSNKGLGLAYIDAFRHVLENFDSEFIFQMDADLSHDAKYMPIFLHYAKTNDLVVGSRFLNSVSIKDRKVWRNVISKSTKCFIDLVTGMRLTDVTSGFKCFKRRLVERLDFSEIRSKGYAFQIETSYAAMKLGAGIKEIPI